MIVLDASAAIEALVARDPNVELLRRLDGDDDLRAPHLIDIEISSGLRRLVAARELSADRAADALLDLHDLRIVRYPHLPLVDRIWELRDRLTAYDAAYVALAEILGVPLVTCDARLARSRGHDAVIELLAPA